MDPIEKQHREVLAIQRIEDEIKSNYPSGESAVRFADLKHLNTVGCFSNSEYLRELRRLACFFMDNGMTFSLELMFELGVSHLEVGEIMMVPGANNQIAILRLDEGFRIVDVDINLVDVMSDPGEACVMASDIRHDLEVMNRMSEGATSEAEAYAQSKVGRGNGQGGLEHTNLYLSEGDN